MSEGFRIVPPTNPVAQPGSPIAPTPGKTFVRTQRTGDPLPDGSKDMADRSPLESLPVRQNDAPPFRNLK